MKAYQRADLIQQGLCVPAGKSYLPITDKGWKYRWLSEDGFQINHNGKWANAYSIDFDFR
jgi:hypothetical protein